MNDIIQDDPSVPAETRIYFSLGNAIATLIVGLIELPFCIFMCTKGLDPFALIFGVVGAYLIYRSVIKISNRKPQLILSDKGIETEKNGFIDWKDITNEQVVTRKREYSRSGPITTLEYDDTFGTLQLLVDDLNVKKKALVHMLWVYRSRYEKEKADRPLTAETVC